jgi:hypothetical protein
VATRTGGERGSKLSLLFAGEMSTPWTQVCHCDVMLSRLSLPAPAHKLSSSGARDKEASVTGRRAARWLVDYTTFKLLLKASGVRTL